MSIFKSKWVSRFITDYGMALVLVLLCIYYSVATLQPQQAVGVEGARQLARQIQSTFPSGARIVVVCKNGADGTLFLNTLEQLFVNSNIVIVDKAQGEPADARRAIHQLALRNEKLDAIATTQDCASWAVFSNIPLKSQSQDAVKLLAPHSYNWPTFLKADNILNVANQVVVISLLAVGMTLVIITGGIDLSVGSIVALSAVVSTLMIQKMAGYHASVFQMWCGAGVGIAVCGLIGGLTGSLITLFRLPPFIATLGMMQVASGIAYIVAKGQSIYEIPDSFVWLGRGTALLGIPNAVLLMAVIYSAAHVIMSRTTLGRYIYAIGGNVEAARLSGVRVRSILLFVYTISGLIAGLGGVVVASQLKSGSPTYGQSYELYAIAAVVVGGTSLAGGSGKILGTLIGAFIIAVIQNGMNLTQTESYRQKVVLGVIILAAVMLDMFRKHGWRMSLNS